MPGAFHLNGWLKGLCSGSRLLMIWLYSLGPAFELNLPLSWYPPGRFYVLLALLVCKLLFPAHCEIYV